ncbi:MAG: transporter related protein [Nocardioidaceae bacterium]|nr:transporter related protein [Nocardioidaceae bacterium]
MLEISKVSLHFGGIRALDDLSLSVDQGGICALIGPNGAGKTSLFNVVSRVYSPSAGSVTYEGRDLLAEPRHRIMRLGIARTFQNLALWPSMTVRENVMVGGHGHARGTILTAALRLGTRSEEARLGAEADAVLERVGIDRYADHDATDLPFGTLKRVELARALMGSPRLLLLDEPAGGLTHAEVDSLADLIRDIAVERNLTVLLVEHHMGMIMRLSRQVVVLDRGTKIADGTPDEVRRDARVVAAYLGVPA